MDRPPCSNAGRHRGAGDAERGPGERSERPHGQNIGARDGRLEAESPGPGAAARRAARALALAFTAALALASAARPAGPVRIDTDLRVRPLAPRTWVVTHEEPYPANSLVAELGDGSLLLVGTPYTPEATERLLVWLRARFGPRPLVAVNPHFHWDALGGNAALPAAGAAVHGSDETARLLAEREEALRAQILEWLGDRPAAAPFRTLRAAPPARRFPLREGLHLTFGGDRVDVLFPGPSHAPDLVVVHLPDHGVLFGGCAVLAGERIGNRSDAALPTTWAAAVRTLRDLPAAHVVPGHGDRTDRGLFDHTLKLLREATR